jgi:proline iminopeptidase
LLRILRRFVSQVDNTMPGPNEFVISGNFKDWDRWAHLPKIKVPTLIIAGRHGTMNPDDIRRMGTLIPHSRVVITEGSHLEMYDDQERYFREVVRFIKAMIGANARNRADRGRDLRPDPGGARVRPDRAARAGVRA